MPAKTKRSVPKKQHSESEESDYDDCSSQEEEEEEDYSRDFPSSDNELDYSIRGESENTKQFTQEVTQFFLNAQRMGGSQFTVGGELDPQFGLPGLQVKSQDSEILHTFGFPLSEGNAKELIPYCTPIGDDGKSWRCDSTDITNTSWDELFDDLIDITIKKGLGLGSTEEVDLQFDSLVVCEEGGQPNLRETELDEKVFGTVLILFPSNFTGGEIVVKHGDGEETFDFSKDSIFKPQFVAFYSECDYTIKKITSGYRAFLMCKLVFNGNIEKKPTLNGSEQLIEEFHQLVTKWDAESTSINSLFKVYAFEQVYSKPKVKPNHLIGSDYNIYHILTEYSKKYDDIIIQICTLQMRVEGIDDPDVTLHLTPQNCSEITVPFWCVALKSHLKNMKLFFKSDDEHDMYGYETKKRHLRNACLLIYPKKCQARFSLKFGFHHCCDMLPSFLESNTVEMSINFVRELIAKKNIRTFEKQDRLLNETVIKLNNVELALYFIQNYKPIDYKALVGHFTIEPLREAICKDILGSKTMSVFLQLLIGFDDIPLIQMAMPRYSVNKYDRHYNDCKRELIELAKKCKFTLHPTVMEQIIEEFKQPNQKGSVICQLSEFMELIKDNSLHKLSIDRELKKLEDDIPIDVWLVAREINSLGIEMFKTRIISSFPSYLTPHNCISTLTSASISKELLELLIELVMKKESLFYDMNFVVSFVKFIQKNNFQYLTAKVCEMITKFSCSKTYSTFVVPLTNELVQIIPKSDELDIILNWSIDLIEDGIRKCEYVIAPKASSTNGRVPCICGLCKKLKGFLWSDNEISYTFIGNYTEITHLESMVATNKEIIKRRIGNSIVFTKRIASDIILKETIDKNNQAKAKWELLLKKRRNPPVQDHSVEEISSVEQEMTPSSVSETSSLEPPSKKSKNEIEVICIDD